MGRVKGSVVTPVNCGYNLFSAGLSTSVLVQLDWSRLSQAKKDLKEVDFLLTLDFNLTLDFELTLDFDFEL